MSHFELPAIIEHLSDHWTAPEAAAHFRAALTRRAFLDERSARGASAPDGDTRDHESLEWLGDRVLGLLVAERLWRAFPGASPGRLDRAFDALVSTEPLAQIGRMLGLDRDGALRMGAGEKQQGQAENDKPLAAHVEALLGAAYLAGGLEGARALIEALFDGRWPEELPEATSAAARDSMTRLNELVQKRWRRSLSKNEWEVASNRANPPLWQASVTLPDGLRVACDERWFPSKKGAKAATAEVALRALDVQNTTRAAGHHSNASNRD